MLSNWTVSITDADPGVRELAADLIRVRFGAKPLIQIGYGRCGSTRVASKRISSGWTSSVRGERRTPEEGDLCRLQGLLDDLPMRVIMSCDRNVGGRAIDRRWRGSGRHVCGAARSLAARYPTLILNRSRRPPCRVSSPHRRRSAPAAPRQVRTSGRCGSARRWRGTAPRAVRSGSVPA